MEPGLKEVTVENCLGQRTGEETKYIYIRIPILRVSFTHFYKDPSSLILILSQECETGNPLLRLPCWHMLVFTGYNRGWCSYNRRVVWRLGEVATGTSCSHLPNLSVFGITFLLLLSVLLSLFLCCLLHHFLSQRPSLPTPSSTPKRCTGAHVARASQSLCAASGSSRNPVDIILWTVLNTLYSKQMSIFFFKCPVMIHLNDESLRISALESHF